MKGVACDAQRNALPETGNKSKRIGTRKLAELLRKGWISAVYVGDKDLTVSHNVLPATCMGWRAGEDFEDEIMRFCPSAEISAGH